MTDTELITIAPRHISSFTNSTYFIPSILNFKPMKYPADLETICFYMAIPNSRKSRPNSFNNTPTIYHDGKWKIMDIQWFIDPNRPQYEVDEEDE